MWLFKIVFWNIIWGRVNMTGCMIILTESIIISKGNIGVENMCDYGVCGVFLKL